MIRAKRGSSARALPPAYVSNDGYSSDSPRNPAGTARPPAAVSTVTTAGHAAEESSSATPLETATNPTNPTTIASATSRQ